MGRRRCLCRRPSRTRNLGAGWTARVHRLGTNRPTCGRRSARGRRHDRQHRRVCRHIDGLRTQVCARADIRARTASAPLRRNPGHLQRDCRFVRVLQCSHRSIHRKKHRARSGSDAAPTGRRGEGLLSCPPPPKEMRSTHAQMSQERLLTLLRREVSFSGGGKRESTVECMVASMCVLRIQCEYGSIRSDLWNKLATPKVECRGKRGRIEQDERSDVADREYRGIER